MGLAAGCDKDGEAITGLHHFGFGFIEVGSTTPLPQKGNLYPRVFRLPADRAIINRYGFNSFGHDAMFDHLSRQESIIKEKGIVVGVNLGKNKLQHDTAADYITGLQRFYPLETVKYFVINISSPNTPNLRKIQNRSELTDLLERVLTEKARLETSTSAPKPLLLKISPDLTAEQMRDISQVIIRYSKPAKTRSTINGLIVTNTTISRPASLRSPPQLVVEEGGLSGPPLKSLSTETIRQMYSLTGGIVPIIGVGGIESGVDAYEKITAGASAVQLYTAMTFLGPPVVREVKEELALMLHYNGFSNVASAVGADHRKSTGPRQYPPGFEPPTKSKQQEAAAIA